MSGNFRIESLLSARLFLSPQLVGNRIYFISDLSGRLSLYAMNRGGSVPEPLLPPDIALQNPTLLGGVPFYVFPKLKKILVMIDRDGDENYQPCLIPIVGGIPEPAFGEEFKGKQVHCHHCDAEKNVAFFQVDPRTSPVHQTYRVDLQKRKLADLGTSLYGNWVAGVNREHTKFILIDSYTAGDNVVYLRERSDRERTLLYGKPIEVRDKGEEVPLNSIHSCHFTPRDRGLLFVTSLFEDRYGLGYFKSNKPDDVQPVTIKGTLHKGVGELDYLSHLKGNRYLLSYNIDGCSWVYEGVFDEKKLVFKITKNIVGKGRLSNGVMQSLYYDKKGNRYIGAFSTANSPTQLYLIEGKTVRAQTSERILGIPKELLSSGEDALYISHDGLRISARLYLPAKKLGHAAPYPVIFYIHGGPQSQERPNFAWFSMPLIQFFTLHGFAVFVPNVRGSSGYGLKYMKQVDRDWGGQDRLDHVAGFESLQRDQRLDMTRVGVMGRSYGGYMTLMLVGRHPELWRAGCDMFGPYNMFTFIERIPETWKTYFYMAIGHPEKDREFLEERSPKTYLYQLTCPLLVMQGRNDPRVREAESTDLVNELRAQGKQIDYIVFENEGHDVLKYENKVKCYNEIVKFFRRHLNLDLTP
ncbi:prolyl oligopeptidase family serine peptidase [Candidatus Acetothermia bacterium]|jgi:dipeptidyl aminopeptidase/acylaminoacyl peptidase|nr:prolyl oligopeptidase family serine peptidase [Candidatus Acetothermia bacterium]MCI2431778.1 prolyl oligopeptidase family serine peptidase [Candidatus Acetothermia bacterium]MCI2436532.1 prolyl oligopeptidase family serine peptidase [Candidatus Acetothermia bacterium]